VSLFLFIIFEKTSKMRIPDLHDIKAAYDRIKPFVHFTPVLTSKLLNERFDCELYFKCENFQKAGAFKFRGATNAVLSLTQEERKRGVVTHSSGNHAAALALAARLNGIKANIVMPENAPEVKKRAVAGYGAEITFCQPTQLAREESTRLIMEKTGATLVHPYDNFNVICGQGTAALELLEKHNDLEIIIAPVGGGGLISGTAICSRSISSSIRIIGAEPANADDAFRSFMGGRIFPSVNPRTMADGLLTSLSELTFSIIRSNVDAICTVKEESILECMLLVWERMKIVIEPSSATVLAAIKEYPEVFRGRKTGLIISGGNVDFRNLPF
jgi:threonine dehydratase